MDSPERKRVPGYRWITILAGVLLVVLYGGLFVAVRPGGFVPGSRPIAPVGTPTITSTPHILVTESSYGGPVLSEGFSSGLRDWELEYATGKLEAVDGMMVLQSNISNQIALALNQNFMSTAFKYYVQADLMSDVSTGAGYGLVFGANGNGQTFYIFEIMPRARSFRLWRLAGGAWQQLSDLPRADQALDLRKNTLGVLFDNGTMNLYINGKSVFTYFDKEPLRANGVGVYVSRPGFRLLVDNFFGYIEK